MRVTNNMTYHNFLSSLNKSLERENKIQEQLSDGKAIHSPSDDPVKAIRSLRFNTNLVQNEQYSQNLQDGQSWMNTTDGEMSDLSSIMINIKEQVVQASTGTTPQDAVQTIGRSVDNLINQIVTIGNTKIGDRYVFAGQQDKTQPFTRTGDTITYSGDNQKISMPIQPGNANPFQDSVNLTGNDVFGANVVDAATGQVTSTPKILQDLIDIKTHLESGTPADQQWLSNTGLKNLDDDHNQLLQAQTELGTRMSAYDMAKNILDSQNTIITGDLSANEDLDVPKAIMDLKNSENVYNAALSLGARIMPKSLVDFLQ